MSAPIWLGVFLIILGIFAIGAGLRAESPKPLTKADIGVTTAQPSCKDGEILVGDAGVLKCWSVADIKAGKLPKP